MSSLEAIRKRLRQEEEAKERDLHSKLLSFFPSANEQSMHGEDVIQIVFAKKRHVVATGWIELKEFLWHVER